MQKKSRNIDSNQTAPHEKLVGVVQKHLTSEFKKPIAEHTQAVFDQVQKEFIKVGKPLIFDSCCGVGDSTRVLAQKHPNHFVLGVDKSESRTTRERAGVDPVNMHIVRADLNDFYRLMMAAGWQAEKHYVLYPNPWPKSAHLGRRWHGAPVFPAMLNLGGKLELRSNWKLYLEEFQIALKLAGHSAILQAYEPDEYYTPFEKKYHQSEQKLWRLTAGL